jgi:ribosomal protein S18 acetylase RimI-like enzyme
MSEAHAALEIHALRPVDLPAYKALRDQMLAQHEDAFTSDAASESTRSAESYRFRLAQPGAHGTLFTLGAWRADELVGAITCERDGRAKVLHIGHIVGMMVRGDMQGRGVGQALLHTALKLARADASLEQLILTVTASNHGAVRLYARHGFVRYGSLPRAIKLAPADSGPPTAHPVYLDKDLMVCPLR